jgi:hypothetical protein
MKLFHSIKNIILLCLWATASVCLAGERYKPTHEITELKLQVIYATEAEIQLIRSKYKENVESLKGVKVIAYKGFSVLLRNKKTGTYTCVLYRTRPQYVDDQSTITVGHEIDHCLLGNYHK